MCFWKIKIKSLYLLLGGLKAKGIKKCSITPSSVYIIPTLPYIAIFLSSNTLQYKV